MSADGHRANPRERSAVAPYPELHELARTLESLGGVAGRPLQELRAKLAARTFNLVVAGQFKRGKTSVINSLIGDELLPVGVIPLTSVVTILSHGPRVGIEVVFEDERRETIAPDSLGDYVTEKGNPRNAKGVREVWITHPSPWLRGGVRLIDTPGIGSIHRHNTDVALRFLPHADAVLFLLSVDQPIGEAERDFLKEVAEQAGKVFVLLNKIDLVSAAELAESRAFTEEAVRAILGRAPVYGVSARGALAPPVATSSAHGFAEFSAALRVFLLEEKGRTLLRSVARRALRLIAQTRFRLELELKSLQTPLAELKDKIRAFETKRAEVLATRDDYAVLMDGEVKKLLRRVEDDLDAFRPQLAGQLLANLADHYQEHRRLPLKALYRSLEQHVLAQIRSRYDEWRASEDARVAQAFNAACARLAERHAQTVDALYRFSSELFAVPFDAVRAESQWTVESGFYYRLWSEPTSLEILRTSALFALPKALGDRWVLKRIRALALEYADMQAGRVRYDFAQRLERGARDFKRSIAAEIEATVTGVEAAVTKGARRGEAAAQEVAQREQALTPALGRLGEAQARLSALMETRPDPQPVPDRSLPRTHDGGIGS